MIREKSSAEEEIRALLRENIRNIVPYSTARDDCKARMEVYLDANENPYPNGVNRYPSPHQPKLKSMLSVIKKIPAENIFVGNGSDEPIDLIFRMFCPPGESSMVQIVPTYGMYSVAAAINDVRVIDAPLDDGFTLDADTVLSKVENDTRVIFLCSPNNPSGNLLDRNEIVRILDNFNGITVVDEAYIDFADSDSFVSMIGTYPRLIVLQTLSKAWGMAGLRIGLAITCRFTADVMSGIKYPYNVSILNQTRAEELLENPLSAFCKVREIKEERTRLASALSGLDRVAAVYPSDANFLLVKFTDKDQAFDELFRVGIIVRDRSSACGCENCLRITVGTPEENDRVISVLSGKQYTGCPESKCAGEGRTASCFRKTGETAVSVKVDLDHFRKPEIATGLHFFDHMLEQIGFHGGISLDIACFGDLATDDHHSVEDVAIALGDCLKEALGDKSGIGRYGFCLPMDEAEAFVLMDLGGRIDFRWDVPLHGAAVGDVSSQMFGHFFKSLSEHLDCNLHVRASGENDHHIIEGVFKAFARALGQAVRRIPSENIIPSSKGRL